jgi:multisubunit Na+/H+ antiporter MnhE subunit
MRRAVSWLSWWVALFVLWLLYVGTIDRLELVAGAAAAAIGATAAEVVRSQGLLGCSLELREAAPVWRIVYRLPFEFGLLVEGLWRALVLRRRVRGRFRTVSYGTGGSEALVTLAGTITPNTIVVDVDRGRKRFLLHDLLPEHGREQPL